jgi:hypothetical protein
VSSLRSARPGRGSRLAGLAALEWLAVPGSGAAIVGLLLTILLTLRALFTPAQAS